MPQLGFSPAVTAKASQTVRHTEKDEGFTGTEGFSVTALSLGRYVTARVLVHCLFFKPLSALDPLICGQVMTLRRWERKINAPLRPE